MKIFFSAIVIVCLFSFAPKPKCPLWRVYAYSQDVLSGKPPNGPVEEGQSEPAKQGGTSKTHYLIYIIPRNETYISLTALWINGQTYEVKTDTVKNLPVKIPGTDAAGNSTVIKLVPATSKTVIQLTPGPVLNFFAPPEIHLQKLLDTHEMVIEYRWQERSCYFSVEKIKRLGAVAAS
jgi:hypothetical protein